MNKNEMAKKLLIGNHQEKLERMVRNKALEDAARVCDVNDHIIGANMIALAILSMRELSRKK